MKTRFLQWLAGLAGALLAATVFAAATVQSVSGDVSYDGAGRSGALLANQTVASGATVATGAGGRAILRFDDGMIFALSTNSTLKIDDYRYDATKPADGNAVFSIIKGALRVVTGLIGANNRERVALRTPVATIGIRGTDFMVAHLNPSYVSVIGGAVTATNLGGTAEFSAGQTATVASNSDLAAGIPASALPALVSTAFAELGALPLVGAAAGGLTESAAGVAGAATDGVLGAGTVVPVALGLVGAAAVIKSSDATPISGQ